MIRICVACERLADLLGKPSGDVRIQDWTDEPQDCLEPLSWIRRLFQADGISWMPSDKFFHTMGAYTIT